MILALGEGEGVRPSLWFVWARAWVWQQEAQVAYPHLFSALFLASY